MSQKPEITFKYLFNYNYNPTYVNGAQGGVSPRGEIVIHYYLERPPLPNSITHEITPQGAVGRETAIEPEDMQQSLVRFIDTGVVMNYENARMFHAWLGEKLKEAEAMHEARESFARAQGGAQA
jgi:cellulase/cellobiase CelA1